MIVNGLAIGIPILAAFAVFGLIVIVLRRDEGTRARSRKPRPWQPRTVLVSVPQVSHDEDFHGRAAPPAYTADLWERHETAPWYLAAPPQETPNHENVPGAAGDEAPGPVSERDADGLPSPAVPGPGDLATPHQAAIDAMAAVKALSITSYTAGLASYEHETQWFAAIGSDT